MGLCLKPKIKKKEYGMGNEEYSRIVFERYGDRIGFPLGIFTINPDGGDCLQIRQTGKCPEWSPDGNWIVFEDLPEGYEDYATNIYIMKPNGKEVRQLTRHTDGRAYCPTWSPDSKNICYSLSTDEGSQIWTVDIESLQQKQLTHEDDSYPFWTPFNKIVFFNREGFVLIMDSDGKNQREYDLFSKGDDEPRWSRDGNKIVFIRDGGVCVMDANGGNLQTIPIAPESAPAYRAAKASLSPDGRKITYSSRQRELYGYEIYVMDIDGKNKKRITTHPLGSDGGEVSSIGICWSPWLKEVNIESNEVDRNTAANEYYNRGVLAADKGLYARSIQEYEKALEYNPLPEAKILITCNLATTLLLKIDVPNRKGGGSDLSDEEYKDLQKSLGLYEQVIKMYEGLGEDAILESKLPLKELYDQAKTNIKAYGLYGLTKWDAKKGHLVLRNSKPTEEEIREKRQALESEIKDLKQDRSKKYSEAGKIAYAKYKNNEPNFTGVSDIRIKWYAILTIDSEIDKINLEIEALNSREKKSGFFAKLGDTISSTAKKGKFKIDLYTIGNKKEKAITEFGEQLYIDHKKETITLEELSSTWQGVGELEKQIKTKEDEISHL